MKVVVYFMDGRVSRAEREMSDPAKILDIVTGGVGTFVDCSGRLLGLRVYREVDPATKRAFTAAAGTSYSYRSVSACLSRYFALEESLATAGNMSMDPHDTIRPTKTSADSMVMLECLDLALLLHGLIDDATVDVLRVEFTRGDCPITGAPKGKNKLEILRTRLGNLSPRNATDYLDTVRHATSRIREELEVKGWVPVTKRNSRAANLATLRSLPQTPAGKSCVAKTKSPPSPDCPGPRLNS